MCKLRAGIPAAILFVGSVLALPASAQSSNQQSIDEVMALVKAQWAASNQKNTTQYMKNVADDYTEFNADYGTRIDGKALNTRLSEGADKDAGKVLVAEMANPKVQVYGDVAVLSYNYVGLNQDKDGNTEPAKAKSTRVYVKQGGQWMLVHANFGLDPMPD